MHFIYLFVKLLHLITQIKITGGSRHSLLAHVS